MITLYVFVVMTESHVLRCVAETSWIAAARRAIAYRRTLSRLGQQVLIQQQTTDVTVTR